MSTTGSSTSEQSITINDPVKVTITVVQGTEKDQSQGQTSSTTTATDKADDLTQLGKVEATSSGQSITINEPKQVTITVVKATGEEKSTEPALASSPVVEETTVITTTTTTAASEPVVEVDDLMALPKTSSQQFINEVKTEEKESKPIVQEPDASAENKNEAPTSTPIIEEVKESTPALSSSAPAVEETTITTTTVTETTPEEKKEETPASASNTSVEEKKESEAPLASAAPASEETTTTTTTTTEEKKDEAPTAASSPPTSDQGQKPEETTTTITVETSEEKKDEAPVAASAAPTSDQGQKPEETTTTTTTTTVETSEEKKDEAPAAASPAPTSDQGQKPEETTTTVEISEEKKEEAPLLASSSSAPASSDNASTEQTTTTTVTSTEEKKEEAAPQVFVCPPTPIEGEPEDKSKSEATDGSDKKDQSAPLLASSSSNDTAFPIVKDNAKNLTDFQRKKAEYFFNINLDIENKKFITWEDVEFYLLFHVTAAGKEGADGGDLEARLSRAARALWEHIHDQIPSDDKNRDKLTLDQFLNTWASLIDYIIKNSKLPDLVQDLVNLGFELYSTKSPDNTSATILPSAFEQLFQKMSLARSYAPIAYQFLTDNGTKPLDADRVNSLVRAAITSSDDGHNSQFLLPGFFKTLTSKPGEKDNTKQTPAADQDKSGQQTSATSPQPGQQNTTSTQPQTPGGQQQAGSQQPGGSQQQQQPGGQQQQPGGQQQQQQQQGTPQQPGGQQQQQFSTIQQLVPEQQKVAFQKLDNDVRRLLQYYHIDDGDVVEIDDGPVHRVVLVHPERPLPAYIQQNKQLLQQLQSPLGIVSPSNSSNQQGGATATASKPSNDEKSSSTETKPKSTLEERVSRGEAQTGPTIPLVQVAPKDYEPSPNVRQVYPPLSEAEQQEQKKQAQLQANQPAPAASSTSADEQKKSDETTSAAASSTQAKEGEKKPEETTSTAATQQKQPEKKVELTPEEEKKVVESVLKQLTPLAERLVAAEIRRVLSGQTDSDDENGFGPFPFMFGGGPIFATARGGPTGQTSQQQAGGFPGGASFIPPELLMSMVNDFAQVGVAEGMPNYSANVPPGASAGRPAGGFMMFVDENPTIGGQPRNAQPFSGPRF